MFLYGEKNALIVQKNGTDKNIEIIFQVVGNVETSARILTSIEIRIIKIL